MSVKKTTSRSRWAAIGAAIAVSIGAGGLMSASASIDTGERAVFVPIVPCRIMDTRPGADNVGSRSTPIGGSETHTISVLGSNGNCTIPADATGLVMNVTAIAPTANSFLTVFPGGATRPTASNLNWVAGNAPVPNAVTVDVPAAGTVSFYNLAGTVNVGADIVGYYVDHTHDDRYYTKAQADAKTMFAVVNANGTLRRGTSGVTSSLFSGGFTGDYTVTFPRSLIACGYVVTAQATAEGNNPVEAMFGVTTSSSNPNAVYVQSNDLAGVDTEAPFTIMVTCN